MSDARMNRPKPDCPKSPPDATSGNRPNDDIRKALSNDRSWPEADSPVSRKRGGEADIPRHRRTAATRAKLAAGAAQAPPGEPPLTRL